MRIVAKHCQQIHQAKVVPAQLDRQQIKADEIRVKGRAWIGWLAMAIMVRAGCGWAG